MSKTDSYIELKNTNPYSPPVKNCYLSTNNKIDLSNYNKIELEILSDSIGWCYYGISTTKAGSALVTGNVSTPDNSKIKVTLDIYDIEEGYIYIMQGSQNSANRFARLYSCRLYNE